MGRFGAVDAQTVTMIEGSQKPKDQGVDDELPLAGKTTCLSALGGLLFLASQGVAPTAAETSITSSFLNEASHGTVTRFNTLIRTVHEGPRRW